MSHYDALDVLGLIFCFGMLLLIGLLWLCTSIPHPLERPKTLPPPRNCRVIRGDNYTVGKARYRFF